MSVNGTQAIDFECTACKAKVSAHLPRVEVVNEGRFSMAIAPHEKTVKCGNCGKAFVFFMVNCETNWSLSAISEEQRRKIEGSDVISLVKGG